MVPKLGVQLILEFGMMGLVSVYAREVTQRLSPRLNERSKLENPFRKSWSSISLRVVAILKPAYRRVCGLTSPRSHHLRGPYNFHGRLAGMLMSDGMR
jgi:hypothetical protein